MVGGLIPWKLENAVKSRFFFLFFESVLVIVYQYITALGKYLPKGNHSSDLYGHRFILLTPELSINEIVK